MTTKSPGFDRPVGIGTTGERHRIDATEAEVNVGTNVMLIYKGKNLPAVVTAVKEPNRVFVGRVEAFERSELEHADLKHGDTVRFSRDDLRWIG